MITDSAIIQESIEEEFGTILRPSSGQTLDDVDPDFVKHLGRTRGAVVLFGFKPDLKVFERFTDHLCQNWQSYRGGVHQKKVLNPDGDSTILSANFYFGKQEQTAFELGLHSDMSYQKNFPQVLFLYCVTPSPVGGETMVCDGARFLRELSPGTRKFFETTRIKYIRTIRPQGRMIRLWTEDEHEARAFCAENDMTLRVEPETENWITEYAVPAIRRSRWNVPVFCNSILTVLDQEDEGVTNSLIRMEDGSKIPADIVAELREIGRRITHDIRWEQFGDFAILDNTRALHGRRMFNDPHREVAQRLAATVEW